MMDRGPEGTYRLKGQKIFITYGEHDLADNIVHLVLARLPDASLPLGDGRHAVQPLQGRRVRRYQRR